MKSRKRTTHKIISIFTSSVKDIVSNMRKRTSRVSKPRIERWASPVKIPMGSSYCNIDSVSMFVDYRSKISNDLKKKVDEYNMKKDKTLTPIRNDVSYFRYLYESIKELLRFGTLHGFKYMVDTSMSRLERIIWAIICILGVITCMIATYMTVFKWLRVPFLVVIDNLYTPVYDIPFPNVIICPENTVKRSYAELTELKDPSLLFAASLICDEMPPQNFSLPHGTSIEEDDKIMKFLTESTPSCQEMIKFCRWIPLSGITIKTTDCCAELFKPILTNNGMCYGFNMLAHLDDKTLEDVKKNSSLYNWTPAGGYKYDVGNSESYPRRVFGVGENYGLTVELYLNKSDSQVECDGNQFGFRVMVNSPIENVMTKTFATISMEKQTTFSIMTSKISSDESLMALKPKYRKCYTDGEVKLTYFNYYTYTNCYQDCELVNIVKYCQCIPFFFKVKSPQTAICKSYENYLCITDVKARVATENINTYYEAKYKRNNLDKDLPKYRHKSIYFPENDKPWCKCYPGCFFVTYDAEVFDSDIVDTTPSKSKQWGNYSTGAQNTSRLKLQFKNGIFYGLHRKSEYSFLDIVAQTGGLLSLFLGFSLMSCVELTYYLVLKPVMNKIKNKRILKAKVNSGNEKKFMH